MDSSQNVKSTLRTCTKCDINALQEIEICLKEVCHRGKHQMVVHTLEKAGLDTTFKDKFDDTALMHACLRVHYHMVIQLLNHPDIDVNMSNHQGWTALMMACWSGHYDVVVELINHPHIDVNAKDWDGWTALMMACESGHHDVVVELLKHPHIDINSVSTWGRRVYLPSGHWTSCPIIAELLGHRGLQKFVSSALMIASSNGYYAIVAELIKHPHVDVNMRITLKTLRSRLHAVVGTAFRMMIRWRTLT